jgi:hypothetical protein
MTTEPELNDPSGQLKEEKGYSKGFTLTYYLELRGFWTMNVVTL